jgi:hypothetical protein
MPRRPVQFFDHTGWWRDKPHAFELAGNRTTARTARKSPPGGQKILALSPIRRASGRPMPGTPAGRDWNASFSFFGGID